MVRRSGERVVRLTGMVLLAATLAACTQQAATQATRATTETQPVEGVHPVSGLDVVPLTVITGTQSHRFAVEVAASPEEQRNGLMFRRELGANEGMIFPYDGKSAQGFWMKNTPLSLDIVFIGPDSRISNIAANTEPYSLESVRSVGPVLGVLELRGGRATELGIAPGDRVEW